MQYPYRDSVFTRQMVVLASKQGDVTGDGVPDHVYLYGRRPDGSPGGFADQITLVIRDGYSGQTTTVSLPSNAGYNARLFLGDFDKDRISDIYVGIDTGGSGGYGIFYIYSCKNSVVRELFNFDTYNRVYTFNVNYENLYKVGVSSPQLDVLFTIDISSKGYDYLSQYYNENGSLKNPVQGQALALGGLFPIVTNPEAAGYDLLALQRIIGTSNADTLGFVENLLSWNGSQFASVRLQVSVPGTKLIAHY